MIHKYTTLLPVVVLTKQSCQERELSIFQYYVIGMEAKKGNFQPTKCRPQLAGLQFHNLQTHSCILQLRFLQIRNLQSTSLICKSNLACRCILLLHIGAISLLSHQFSANCRVVCRMQSSLQHNDNEIEPMYSIIRSGACQVKARKFKLVFHMLQARKKRSRKMQTHMKRICKMQARKKRRPA